MRKITRVLSAGLIAAMVAAMAACGGDGGEEEQTSNGAVDPVEPGLLVSNPSEALGKSVEQFEGEVESVRGRFTIDLGMSGFDMGANGTFAFRAPDSVYMTMEMAGGDGEFLDLAELGSFEILILGDEIFMNTGFTGWVSGSAEDFGADAASFKQLQEGHSPFDYQSLVESLNADVENLGETEVNGKTYTRLRVTTDFARLMEEALDSSLGESGFDESLFPVDFSSPVTMDILLDPETLLPYTFEANGAFGTGEESLDFAMTFTFFDYNGPVDIPEPPADAQPFDELDMGFEG
ncbi:MAG TPA: hypothetical protein VGR43_09125 [Dehalococcoidia bacterium]|nr:hypothetical protein [Dehalococcoidia bacterium]